jgi:hypothetical protein
MYTLDHTHPTKNLSQEDLKKQRATQIAPFRWVEKGWHNKTGKMGFSFFWPKNYLQEIETKNNIGPFPTF